MTSRVAAAARKLGELARGVQVIGWAVAAGLVALLVRLPLILDDHAVTPGGDSASYVATAEGISNGDGFGDAYRTPGYPLLILLLDGILPGGRVDNVVVTQHLLGAALVGLVVLLAARWFDLATGATAAAILAFSPLLPYLEHALLPDFVFAVVLLAFAVGLGTAATRDRPSYRGLAMVGALAAMAAYLRPSAQALVLAMILVPIIALRGRASILRAAGVMVGVFAVLIAPWIVRNAVRFDTPSMSLVAGDTLFVRAFEVDGLRIPTGSASGRLAAETAETRGNVRLVTAYTLALQERGLDQVQTLETQQALAQAAIWRDPWTYARGTVSELAGLRVNPTIPFEGSDVGTHIVDPPTATGTIWDATEWLGTIWWALSLGTVAGLLVLVAPRRDTRIVGMALLLTWLAVGLATALGRGALVRYAIELAPLAVLPASFGAVTLLRAVRSTIAGRATAAGSA